MSRTGGLRRAWQTGLTLTILMSVVWVVSLWWSVSFRMDGMGAIGLSNGCIVRFPENGLAGILPKGMKVSAARSVDFEMPPAFNRDKFGTAALAIWVALAPVAALAFTAWWFDSPQPRKKTLCAQCGYDLRGNTSGVCSECGARVPPARIATA